jgi:hypothetical protein
MLRNSRDFAQPIGRFRHPWPPARRPRRRSCWLSEAFQPGRYIDTVTKQILAVDHNIADMHADPELHHLIGRLLPVLRCDRHLHRDRALHSIDRAREVGEMLSPAVLKIRPRCDAISSSMMARHAFSWASVPASSRAINRL